MASSSTSAGQARAAWEREYAEVHAYTTSYRDELDRGIEFLLAYVEAAGITLEGPLLECACGRGRNAIPLARLGHAVLGLDHALTALGLFVRRAREDSPEGAVLPAQHDLRQPFPVLDASVGAVIDITAIDNLIEPEHQRAYAREIARVLRPGGLAIVVTFDRDDGYYGPFLDNADAEGAVVLDPNTSIRNHLFRGPELDALFCPPLELLAGNRFDFVDEAAQTRWTRRFHLRLYRRPAV